MSRDYPIVTVEEAREILGSDAIRMTDEEIVEVITTLDLLARDALETARNKLRLENDTEDLAQLIYDIYQDKKK